MKKILAILGLFFISYSSLAAAAIKSCDTTNALGTYELKDSNNGVIARFINKSESYEIGSVGKRRQIIEIKVIDPAGKPISLEQLLAEKPIPLNNVLSSLVADLPLDYKQLTDVILEARKNLDCK